MFKKNRKYLKTVIALLITIIILININMSVLGKGGGTGGDTGFHQAGNSSATQNNQQTGTITQIDTSASYLHAWSGNDNLGIRFYLMDSHGIRYKSIVGTDCIDFLWPGAWEAYAANPSVFGTNVLVRSAGIFSRTATTTYYNMSEILSDDLVAAAHSNHSNSPTKNKYFLNDINENWFNNSNNVYLNVFESDIISSLAAQMTASGYKETNVKTWFRILYPSAEAALKDDANRADPDYQMFLIIENTMAIVDQKVSPRKALYYGSYFELAKEKATNTKVTPTLSTTSSSGYRFNDSWTKKMLQQITIRQDISKNGYLCSQQYMTPVTNVYTSSWDEMYNNAFGIATYDFGDFVDADPIESNNVIVPNPPIPLPPPPPDKTPTNTVTLQTGWRSEEGVFNMNTNEGIPTTENIINRTSINTDCLAYWLPQNSNERVKGPEDADGHLAKSEWPLLKVSGSYTYKVSCTHEKKDYCPGHTDKKTGKTTYCGGCKYNGNYEHPYDTESDSYTTNALAVPRGYSFIKLTDYYFYGIDSIEISNQAGSVTYYANNTTVNGGILGTSLSSVQFQNGINSNNANANLNTNFDWDYYFENHADFENHNYDYTYQAGNVGLFDSEQDAQNAIDNILKNQWKTISDQYIPACKIRNDLLKVTYSDGSTKTILDNAQTVTMDNNGITKTNGFTAGITPNSFITSKTIESKENVGTISIPYGLANGDYHTNARATYKIIAAHNQYSRTTSIDINDICPNNCLNDTFRLVDGRTVSYASQEPIHVKTPVISPFHTTNSDKKDNDVNNQTGTQLFTENPNMSQMRLDESYSLTFDPTMHHQWLNYGWSGIENQNRSDKWNGWNGQEVSGKYDKYVLAKEVKFPFEVFIDDLLFPAETWIRVYEYDPTNNKVTPGDVKTAQLKTVNFYIPSWAMGTMYDQYNYTGEIETAVYALNDTTLDPNKYGYERVTATNMSGDDIYYSKSHISVQLSGWIYDFKVTGTWDNTQWTNTDDDHDETTINFGGFSFTNDSTNNHDGDEFFTGIYNRLGKDNSGNDEDLRHDKTDLLTSETRKGPNDHTSYITDYHKDTLPLNSGSSNISIVGGDLNKDSVIQFSVKTMGSFNYNDRIVIEPRFTYYSEDYTEDENGNCLTGYKLDHDDLEIYYTAYDENNNSYPYTLFGSNFDLFTNSSYRINDLNQTNKSVISDEDKIYSVKTRLPESEIKTLNNEFKKANLGAILYADRQKFYTSSLSEIILQNWAMFYDTNATNQLKVNLEREKKNFKDYLSLPAKKGAIINEDKLIQSVQTWYGSYYIPGSMKVLNKHELAGLNAGIQNSKYYDAKTGLYFATANMNVNDSTNICSSGCAYNEAEDRNGCRTELGHYLYHNAFISSQGIEKFWLNDGTLMLNFDIKVQKCNSANQSYRDLLSMNQATNNAWIRQGMRDTAYVYTDVSVQRLLANTGNSKKDITPIESLVSIKTRAGDIAVIRLGFDDSSRLQSDCVWIN